MARRKKEKKVNPWRDVVLKVHEGHTDIPSPFHEEGKIEHVFVHFGGKDKVGYGMIWCSKTHRGLHISRMLIDESLKYVTIDEVHKIKIPKLTFDKWW